MERINQLFRNLLTIVCLSVFIAMPSFAERVHCNVATATENLNRTMVEKYVEKKGFEHYRILLENPRAFFREMQARFERQKQITPDTPHAFDFSEFGMEEVRVIRKNIDEEKQQLEDMKQEIWDSLGDKPGAIDYVLSTFTGKTKLYRDLRVGLEYLDALATEADAILAKGSVDYQTFNEISYFYSRASGYFDRFGMKKSERLALFVEEGIQGYRKHSIDQEFKFYKDRDMSILRRKSFWKANQFAKVNFAADWSDKTKLPFLVLPSHAHLGPDIFHRLLALDIYIVGITRSPIGADGFLRPGGLFWIHDVVHSALIHTAKQHYMKRHNLNEAQFEQLVPYIDKWFEEMEIESRAIQDPLTRRVTRRLLFNMHHDRGYPIAPSAFDHLERIPNDAYLLYFMLENFGHGVKMERGSYKKVKEGGAWIHQFWGARKAEEQQVLQAIKAGDKLP